MEKNFILLYMFCALLICEGNTRLKLENCNVNTVQQALSALGNRQKLCLTLECNGKNIIQHRCRKPTELSDCTEMPADMALFYPDCCPRYTCIRSLGNGDLNETRIYGHNNELISIGITMDAKLLNRQ